MEPLVTNRKVRMLFEHGVQSMFVIVGEVDEAYLGIEITDIKSDISGKDIDEIQQKITDLEKETGNKMVGIPKFLLNEELWVADDDDLDLSIFDLIKLKLPSPTNDLKNIDLK